MEKVAEEIEARIAALDGRQRKLAERLWSKCVPCDGVCIVWGGWVDPGTSYPRLRRPGVPRQTVAAARLMWECLIGPIPPGSQVRHACKNSRCLNPSHLRLVIERRP